jgi:hypothetical protein
LTRDEQLALQWDAEQPYLVAARRELTFSAVSVSGIPPEAQERFLAIEAMRLSPARDMAYHMVRFDRDTAMLWVWDAEWERRQRESLPAAVNNVPLIPETLLHPRGDDGALLRHCAEGYDFQVWQGGCLKSSRWFAQKPEPAGLQQVMRAERIDALLDCEREVAWLPRPWSDTGLGWKSLLRDEKTVFAVLASILLLFACFELGQGAVSSAKAIWAQSRLESLQLELGDKMQQRQQAERQRDINRQWISVFEPFSQLDVVAEFTLALEGSGYQLINWEYIDGTLQVVVSDEDIDMRDVVSRLAQRDLFEDLRIEPGVRDGESVITMQLPALERYR